MKLLAAVLLIALFSFIGGLYAGWWVIVPVAFLVAFLVPLSAGWAWASGFLAVFFLWVMLCWWINSANNSILAARIGELLGIGNNPALLIIITAGLGGLVAGFAALTGHYLRPVLRSNPS